MSNSLNKILDLFTRNPPVFGESDPNVSGGKAVFDKDETLTLEIETRSSARKVIIGAFSALDGWTVKHRMRDFAATTDDRFRRQFTLLVLARASVDGRILDTESAINECLEHWGNIERVFHAVLEFNAIDAFVNEDIKTHWQFAGAEIAATFVTHMNTLLAPTMDTLINSASSEGIGRGKEGEEKE